MFDAGASPKHVREYYAALERAGEKLPDLVALSHWHWDHSFGMCAIEAPVIASRLSHDTLVSMQRWEWDDASRRARVDSGEDALFGYDMIKREYGDCTTVRVVPADIVFDGTLTLDLGGVAVELIHIGGPHSVDSVVCYVPSDRFIFLGDSNGKDLLGLPWHYDPEHPEKLLETFNALPYDPVKRDAYMGVLEGLDFTHCIGGHADPMTRDELFRSLSDR